MRHQIYEVFPGQPFGRGKVNGTIDTTDPCARAGGVSGTSTSTSLTVGTGSNRQGTFNDGDLIAIFQIRGTGAGTWELNYIVSGASTGTWTLGLPLGATFTHDGNSKSASRAQVIQVREYKDLLIRNFTPQGWRADQNYALYNYGGICMWAASGRRTFQSGANANFAGGNGWSSGTDHHGDYDSFMNSQIGGGFRGGYNSTDGNTSGNGEGYAGNYHDEIHSAQGNGGRGSNGDAAGGGSNDSSTDMDTLYLAGAGGGGRGNNGSDTSSSGSNGGGTFIEWAYHADNTNGTFNLPGGNASTSIWASQGGAGSGSGGNFLGNYNLLIMDTNKMNVAAGSPSGQGSAGTVGKVRLNIGSKIISGSNAHTPSIAIDSKLRNPSNFLGLF